MNRRITLKITPATLKAFAAEPVSPARADAARAASNSGSSQTRGAVDLSPAARHLSSLESTDNDINMVKVEQLRAAIESGELKIDVSRIADGLLSSARELLK